MQKRFIFSLSSFALTPVLIINACAITNYQIPLVVFNQIETHLNHPIATRNRQSFLASQFPQNDLKQLLKPLSQIDNYQINYDLQTISANDYDGYLAIDFSLTNNEQNYHKQIRLRGFKTTKQVQAETNDAIVANWTQHLNQSFYDQALDAYVVNTSQPQISVYQGLQQNPLNLIKWWKSDPQDQTSLWNYQEQEFSTLQLNYNFSPIQLLTIDQLNLPAIYFQIELRKNANNQSQPPGHYVRILITGFKDQNDLINKQPWNQWLQQWFFQIDWKQIDWQNPLDISQFAKAIKDPEILSQGSDSITLSPPLGISKWTLDQFGFDQAQQQIRIRSTIMINQQTISSIWKLTN